MTMTLLVGAVLVLFFAVSMLSHLHLSAIEFRLEDLEPSPALSEVRIGEPRAAEDLAFGPPVVGEREPKAPSPPALESLWSLRSEAPRTS